MSACCHECHTGIANKPQISQRKLRVNESSMIERKYSLYRREEACQFSPSIAKVRALFSPTPYRLYSKIALRHGYIGVTTILNIYVLTSNSNIKSHNFYQNNRHHGKRSRNGSAPYHIRLRKGCPRPSLLRGVGGELVRFIRIIPCGNC